MDAINSTTARLSWTVGGSNRGFRVQIRWSGTSWQQNGTDIDKTARTFDYGGLAARTTYAFRVCQRSGSKSGNCSNAKSVRTRTPEPLAAPTRFVDAALQPPARRQRQSLTSFRTAA